VDDPFRAYDYYAGVYDGLIAVRNWSCGEECPATEIGHLTDKWTKRPTIGDGHGVELLKLFLALEPTKAPSTDRSLVGVGGLESAARSSPLSSIFFALTEPARCQNGPGGLCMADCSFATFVDALHDRHYGPVSDYGHQILSRGDDWWTPLALGVSDRLENLEDGLAKPSPWLTRVRMASSLTSGYYYWSSQDTLIVPSSIARRQGLHFFLPYLVFGPTNERRVDIGLLHAGPCRGKLCLSADVSARGGAMNDKSFGAFRWGAEWAADGHLGLKIRNIHWALSSLQLSAGRSIPGLDGFPHDNSLEIDFGLLFDRFRFGLGTNYSSAYFVLGLGDLTGWATTIR
jgi:hypothetical protein